MYGNVIGYMINNFDLKIISFSCGNLRSWEFSVDRHDCFCLAQSCNVFQLNLYRRIGGRLKYCIKQKDR